VARRARVAALAVAFAGAVCGAAADAYATLHVRSFTMSVDRATVDLGEPFHLRIATHIDERVAEIDDLTLPDLAGFDSLGDERRCVASATGSDCDEIVTLAGTVPGTHTISGATFDAIDARNGKPSRFTTDSIVVNVVGVSAPDQNGGVLAGFAFGILRAALILALVGIALFALVWGFALRGRKPQPVAAGAPAFAPAPAPAPDPDAWLRDLARSLEADPSRASALRVRHALRDAMTASETETFADLRARGAAPPAQLAALGAVERAAFCEDERVADAVREAVPFLLR
jgi:hypothetical protein